MQLADHRQAERPPLRQYLGHAPAPADELADVRSLQPALLHDELDQRDRVRRLDRVMLGLIGFDEGRKHIEAVAVAPPLQRQGIGSAIGSPAAA